MVTNSEKKEKEKKTKIQTSNKWSKTNKQAKTRSLERENLAPPKARSTAEHSRDNKLTNMEQRTKHKNQETQGASPEQVRAKINSSTMQIKIGCTLSHYVKTSNRSHNICNRPLNARYMHLHL
jgi:hypothetical protein